MPVPVDTIGYGDSRSGSSTRAVVQHDVGAQLDPRAIGICPGAPQLGLGAHRRGGGRQAGHGGRARASRRRDRRPDDASPWSTRVPGAGATARHSTAGVAHAGQAAAGEEEIGRTCIWDTPTRRAMASWVSSSWKRRRTTSASCGLRARAARRAGRGPRRGRSHRRRARRRSATVARHPPSEDRAASASRISSTGGARVLRPELGDRRLAAEGDAELVAHALDPPGQIL